MTDREQLYQALRNADAAGDTEAASKLVAYIKAMPAETPQTKPARASDQIPGNVGISRVEPPAANYAAEPDRSKDNLLGKIWGNVVEPVLSVGTGIGATIPAGAAALYNIATNGKYGTQEGAQEAKGAFDAVANEFTYHPTTESGKANVQAIGNAINDSGIVGVPIPEIEALGRGAAASRAAFSDIAGANAAAMGAQDAAMAAGGKGLRDLLPTKKAAMSGVGAAVTDEALLRAQRAADLPVPIDLTKGQATRTFEQQRFERETAKLPKEGAPLRERFSQQNQQVFQNFDAFIDATGAEQYGLRPVGQVVSNAIISKFKEKKAAIRQAYNDAKQAGDMSELVDVAPIRDYIESNRSAMENAPILSSVEKELNRLTGGGETLSINGIEQLRKMTGRLGKPNMANSNDAYSPDIVGVIDAVTDGKGGPKYQQARRMYENFSNEFTNVGVIDKMLSKKPGTKDRAVAFEDVLDHTIFKGSLDDVRAVRRTLQTTTGEDGPQAWRELQGATIGKIKNAMFENIARDEAGNPVGSPYKLDSMVKGLDEDGKLDFIFGKKGAQQIRDVNDMAKDIYTSPPGSVNHSNTASVLIGLLDTAVSGVAGMPLPIGSAINYGVKRVKSNAVKKQVDQALAPTAGIVERPVDQGRLRAYIDDQKHRKVMDELSRAQSVDDAIKAVSEH